MGRDMSTSEIGGSGPRPLEATIAQSARRECLARDNIQSPEQPPTEPKISVKRSNFQRGRRFRERRMTTFVNMLLVVILFVADRMMLDSQATETEATTTTPTTTRSSNETFEASTSTTSTTSTATREPTTLTSTRLPDLDDLEEDGDRLDEGDHLSMMNSMITSTTQSPSSPAITPSSFNNDDDNDEASFAFTTQHLMEMDATSENPNYALASSELPPARAGDQMATTTVGSLALQDKSSLISEPGDGDGIETSTTRPSKSSQGSNIEVATLEGVASSVNDSASIAAQLVRSRKSPENGTTIANQAQLSPPRNSTPPAQSQAAPVTPFDYDDFDLDYQLKLSPELGQTGGPATASSQQQQQLNLYKRDHDNQILGPNWLAQLGQQPSHLFNSSTRNLSPNSNITPRPHSDPTSGQQPEPNPPPNLLYHGTPPIMPALLTIKSAPLTSQELSKARPHFLFYPDQYSEFNGPNSYHAASEALANGDLLATASNSELRMSQQQQQRQQLMAGANQQQANNNNTASLPLSGDTNSSSAMISLINGSPIVNKQAIMNSFMQHQSSPMFQLTSLRASRPKLGQASITTEDDGALLPSVTTIVVDNSVPTTENPLLQPAPQATTDQPSSSTTPTPTTPPSTSSTTTTTEAAITTTATSRSVETSLPGGVNLNPGGVSTNATSQAHQWFNYPHPNLHQNPLLLHHILNKPASFYVKNAVTSGPPQHLSPLSLLTTTTTEMPVGLQTTTRATGTANNGLQHMQSQFSQTTRLPASSGQSEPVQTTGYSISSTGSGIQQTSAIERPAFSATRPFQQPPVNLTLLQMQLDEMRSIAEQTQSNQNQNQNRNQNQNQNVWQQQQQLALNVARPQSDTSSRGNTFWTPKITNMPRPPMNVLHHLVGGGQMMPPQLSANNQHHYGTSGQSVPVPQVIQVNHHHHHVGRPAFGTPQLPPAFQHVANQANHPRSQAQPAPLASQMIVAPSFLQDAAAHPSSRGAWSQNPNPLHHHNQNQSNGGQDQDLSKYLMMTNQTLANKQLDDSLNVAASMSSSRAAANSTQDSSMLMNDEDMSTYVALLASLSNSQSQTKPEPNQPDSTSGSMSMTSQLMQPSSQAGEQDSQQLLSSLLEQLLTNEAVNKSSMSPNELNANNHLSDTPPTSVVSGSYDTRQLELLNPGLQNNDEARSWVELLRGAKLIGLSDEVQAQIYRDHLAPLIGQSSSSPSVRKPSFHHDHRQTGAQLISGSGFKSPMGIQQARPQANNLPIGQSSNQLRTIATTTTVNNQPQTQAIFKNAYGPTRPQQGLSLQQESEARKRLLQQEEMLRLQRQRQVAFMEAMQMSLAQWRDATGELNSTRTKDHQASLVAKDPLAATESEQDESLANSSSRPTPEWLGQNNEQHQETGVAQMQEFTRPGFNQIIQHANNNNYHHQLLGQPMIPPPRPSWFQAASRVPLFRVPSMSLTRPATGSSAPAPIQVYPLRSLWNLRQHHSSGSSAGSGPQPRLLWPVYPAGHPSGQALEASQSQTDTYARLVPQQTVPIPLVRMGPAPPPMAQLQPLINLQHHHQFQPQTVSTMSPNRVMLDRFPLASAPAYLVKLPTLTGGTITASGSLVSPGSRLLRRPGSSLPPAAFISATPLGALRFLSALAPPRMRLIQTGIGPTHAQLAQGTAGQFASPSSNLIQPASSMIHVGHSSPMAHYNAMGLQSASQPVQLHLSPMAPHGHYHGAHPFMASNHHQNFHPLGSLPLQPPSRLQVYLGGTAPASLTESLASSQTSPEASGASPAVSGTMTGSTSGSDESSGTAAGNGEGASSQGGHSGKQTSLAHSIATGNDQAANHQHQMNGGTTAGATNNGNALARLQQATASLVELTSLASLLDEMVGGGSDTDSSPAMALANAINSLSAAQNVASATTLSTQASQATTSERLVPSSGSSSSSAQQLQQQQQQPQSGALFWKNLLVPGLLRQQSNKFLSSGNKLRDLTGLERLLAHTQAIGSPHHPTARLRVKYIRVPVAVYETTSANGVVTSSLNQVNPNGSQGALLSSLPASPTSSSTSHDDSSLLAATGGSFSGASDHSISSHTLGQGGSGSPPGSISTSGGHSAAASNSNEFLFDEMSSESGPQTHYLLQQPSASLHQSESQLNFVPIVRAVNQRPMMAQHQLLQPLRRPLGDISSLESGNLYSIVSSAPSPVQQQQQQQSLLSESSSTRGKKKKKKTKKGKGEDDDEEDEETEDDDDDALSPNDLPMIESLISTIIHGQPTAAGSGLESPISQGGGWRSLRGAGSHRNRFHISPEASSTVYTYAQPGGTGTSQSLGSHLMSPFKKQRFSLSDVVGALGAKKLISSLLGRRSKTARESRHKSIKAGPLGGHQLLAEAASANDEAATTRMPPPRELLAGLGANRNPARLNLGSPFTRRSFLGQRRKASKPNDIATTKDKSRMTSSQSNKSAAAATTSTITTTARPVVESEIEATSGAGWPTSTRRPRPLVFPAIVAYDFDSSARIRRRSTTTKRPQRVLALTSRPSSQPPSSTNSIGAWLVANTTTVKPTASITKPMSGLRFQSGGSRDSSELHTSNSNKDKPTTIDELNHTAKPDQHRRGDVEAAVGAGTIIRLVSRSRDQTSSAMPLYHIVADHFSKINAGRDITPPSGKLASGSSTASNTTASTRGPQART